VEHLLRRDDVPPESSDRKRRTVERQRRNDGIHARAIEQTRVDNRLRFVDAAADLGDDFFDNVQQVRVVLESHGGQRKLAGAFDVDLIEAVHENVGDGRFLEQRLEWTQAEHFVEHFLDHPVLLGGGHGGALVF
jgi:hypothetical protein